MSRLLVTIDYPPTLGGIASYYAGLCASLPVGSLFVLAPVVAEVPIEEVRLPFDGRTQQTMRKKFFWRFWPHWLPLLWNITRTIPLFKGEQEGVTDIWVGQVLPVGTAVWLLKRLGLYRGIYSVFVHGMDIGMPKKGTRKHRLMMRVLRDANRIIANSNFVRERVAALGIPSEKIVVVHPGVTLPPHVPESFLNTLRDAYDLHQKKVILTVTRLVTRKGVDHTIEAIARLRRLDIVYVIVGDGPERERLQAYAQSLGPSVRFVGAVSRKELDAWYALSDLFAMTPRQIGGDVEGFGIVYLEANAHGKPVVATRTGGVPEAVVDRETGLLVAEGDIEGITRAIKELLDNGELRVRLGAQGRARVEREFLWSYTSAPLFRLEEKPL